MLERVESKTRSQKSSHMKATDLIANLQFLLYHLSPAQSLLYHLLPPARPASSVPSSISSPVISSSTSAVACSKHVIGASGKKFKAFHKKDGSESGSCELIDHPTNSNVQGAVDNTPLPTNIFKPFCSMCLPCLWTNSCASTVRGVSEKGNGSVFEGNMFKLRYFNRYQLYLCNNASRKKLVRSYQENCHSKCCVLQLEN